jgi:Family of unknown function (DUF5995)
MPANTISEVIDQLDEIVNLAQQNADRAGYFAALYGKVTKAVSDRIKEKYFDDNERMEKLDVVFANRYIDAWHQYKSGKPCSISWQLAFDATSSWKPMVIDHLVAGMNAHIGLDLGIAAATVSPGDKINDVHNDFNKINSILNGLVNEVKADLFAMWPLSRFISGLQTGNLENDIAGFSMTIARDAAWAFGNKLLYPGIFLGTVKYVFRIFEFGSIPEKIKRLDQ